VLTTYTYFEGEGEANSIDRKWLYSKRWGCCVLDEAHALKRADSARYIRLSKLRSAQRVLLTGTPVQNNTRELLTLLSFMLPSTFPPGLASAFAAGSAGAEDAAEVRRVITLTPSPFPLSPLITLHSATFPPGLASAFAAGSAGAEDAAEVRRLLAAFPVIFSPPVPHHPHLRPFSALSPARS
jgi:hypothetical protein